MEHAFYIAWSYVGVGALLLVLIAWVAWDARRVSARLKALEDQGIRRRSAGSGS